MPCRYNSKDEAQKSIIYSYKHGFSGFAAMLTESQAKTIAGNNKNNNQNQGPTHAESFT
jgi:hypothetical protein